MPYYYDDKGKKKYKSETSTGEFIGQCAAVGIILFVLIWIAFHHKDFV